MGAGHASKSSNLSCSQGNGDLGGRGTQIPDKLPESRRPSFEERLRSPPVCRRLSLACRPLDILGSSGGNQGKLLPIPASTDETEDLQPYARERVYASRYDEVRTMSGVSGILLRASRIAGFLAALKVPPPSPLRQSQSLPIMRRDAPQRRRLESQRHAWRRDPIGYRCEAANRQCPRPTGDGPTRASRLALGEICKRSHSWLQRRTFLAGRYVDRLRQCAIQSFQFNGDPGALRAKAVVTGSSRHSFF
jgi:hypothetical protein